MFLRCCAFEIRITVKRMSHLITDSSLLGLRISLDCKWHLSALNADSHQRLTFPSPGSTPRHSAMMSSLQSDLSPAISLTSDTASDRCCSSAWRHTWPKPRGDDLGEKGNSPSRIPKVHVFGFPDLQVIVDKLKPQCVARLFQVCKRHTYIPYILPEHSCNTATAFSVSQNTPKQDRPTETYAVDDMSFM